MIKLKLEFATGEECRNALVALLGGDLSVVTEKPIRDEKIAENFAASETQVSEVETPVKKRRTRAEIEAEVIKKEVTQIAPGGPAPDRITDIQDDGINSETDPAKEASKAVTADMLKEKAVELIRNNKKPEVTALVKSFGADSVATADKNPIKPEDYVRFMDELNKL